MIKSFKNIKNRFIYLESKKSINACEKNQESKEFN